jgi:DUF4097 and DUF4098 domain-containing protein YvlB
LTGFPAKSFRPGRGNRLIFQGEGLAETFPSVCCQIIENIVLQESHRMGRTIVVIALIFVLLAVCAGSVVAVLPVFAAVREGRVHIGWFSLNNVSADLVEEQRLPVNQPASVTVHTPNGRVEVSAQKDAREVVVTSHKYAWGMDTKTAEALLEKVTVRVQQTGDRIDIQVDSPVEVDLLHIGPAGIQVDFIITVPEETAVDASSSSGDIRLEGTRGEARLQSDFGDVYALDLQGGLTVHSDSGKVIVENAGSPESVLDVSSGFGDVVIRLSSAKSLKGHSNSGAVSLYDSKIGESAELTSSFGDVRMKVVEAGSVSLHTSSGMVTLEDVTAKGDAIAGNDFGDILCTTTVAGRYDLETSSGRVEVDSLRGSAKVHSNFGDLILSGADVLLDASTNSGSVTFSGTLGDGKNVLQSNFGDVTVYLPEGSQFHAELKTDFGRVHSDFPVTSGGSGSTQLAGDVGSGGPSLAASTNSGNVEIRILTGAPAAATKTPVE